MFSFSRPNFGTCTLIPFIDVAADALQYNLCTGTLAMYLREQPGLAPLLQRVLDFEVS